MSISQKSSCCDFRLIADLKFSSLRCNASSGGGYRRNPEFSRQNKRGFSRNRNRFNEEKDGYEEFEESESLSSRNGSILSVSGNQKFQATSGPGSREKEIVELFRKVQAQLRERAAVKEERKVEDSQDRSKESNTVDSLLKLLRKHSVQQGKKNNVATNKRDFILDQHEQTSHSIEETGGAIISDDSNTTTVEQEIEESPQPQLSRPRSSFRKRSPVPVVKLQPVYPDTSLLQDSGGKQIDLEAEDDDPLFPEANTFDEMSEDDEASDIYEEEQNLVESNDLSAMKLTELRALAKSRRIKGFSKLKKNDLIMLLSQAV